MKPKRILVVEDQPLIRMVLVEGLTDVGLEVTEAANGDKALELLQSVDRFDLLLTYIQMPGTADGNDVGQFAGFTHPNVPIIYVSGVAGTLKNILRSQDRFLQKPFGITSLVSLVTEMLKIQATASNA